MKKRVKTTDVPEMCIWIDCGMQMKTDSFSYNIYSSKIFQKNNAAE
jgi:hypothetical protein